MDSSYKNLAFYLKYRPQNLNDLIGQESVKKIISGAFSSNKLSHAYLFVGPRGTGKTSTARILAKMVNCEKNDTSVPCNKCPTCLSITDGSNMDLIEIDAASNRGIEDIRSLREKIKLAPSSSKKKVYIIDEVHMLTSEAFNALLKTLEEPPSHTLFILATTEASKVPSTILSRVQILDFKLALPKELMDVLKKIVVSEKIDIDEEALNLLVKKSEGSFRDGVKLLDQIASVKEKITAKTLEENLKQSTFEEVLDLTEALALKNINKSLLNISKQLGSGTDVKDLTLSLMDVLRNIMLVKNGLGNRLVEPNLVEEKYQKLVSLSEKISNHELVRSLDILQISLGKLKIASIPSLPLELAVVEICGETDKTLDNRNLKLENPSSTIQPQNPDSSIKRPPSKPDQITTSEDIIKLKEKWTFVLETIRPVNFSLEALLRSINITECSEVSVVLEVPYSFHQRILEAPKNRDLLESILSDILGRSIKVSTVLGNRPQRKEDIVNIAVAADDDIIRAAAEIFNSDTIN